MGFSSSSFLFVFSFLFFVLPTPPLDSTRSGRWFGVGLGAGSTFGSRTLLEAGTRVGACGGGALLLAQLLLQGRSGLFLGLLGLLHLEHQLGGVAPLRLRLVDLVHLLAHKGGGGITVQLRLVGGQSSGLVTHLLQQQCREGGKRCLGSIFKDLDCLNKDRKRVRKERKEK